MATKPYAVRRRLHQPDERLLRRLPRTTRRSASATTPARSPPATGPSSTATATGCAGNHRMAQPLRGLDRLRDLDALVEQEQQRGPTAP